jgi:hypothetical protein
MYGFFLYPSPIATPMAVDEGLSQKFSEIAEDILAHDFDVKDLTIEAGPTFFAGVADQLPIGIENAAKESPTEQGCLPHSENFKIEILNLNPKETL